MPWKELTLTDDYYYAAKAVVTTPSGRLVGGDIPDDAPVAVYSLGTDGVMHVTIEWEV